jgi:Cu2+-containing amine oxidase
MPIVVSASSSVRPIDMVHPLASLRPEEVIRARDIVAQYNAGKAILWKIIALKEPPKEQVIL